MAAKRQQAGGEKRLLTAVQWHEPTAVTSSGQQSEATSLNALLKLGWHDAPAALPARGLWIADKTL